MEVRLSGFSELAFLGMYRITHFVFLGKKDQLLIMGELSWMGVRDLISEGERLMVLWFFRV
jgi:hypothetical protein